MTTAVLFALAAACGSLARAEAGRRWNRTGRFALGTFAVNVVGAFLLGLLHDVDPPAVTVVGVGGLGAFTTFSSFARDVVAAAEARRLVLAGVTTAGTLLCGVGAAALGIALA